MKYKFQPGVSAIIKKVLEIKDKIKVIPLGMAHQKDGSSIHIGKPVEFSKDGDKYFVDRGNADSTYFDKDLTKLYADKEKMVLTNDGIPVGEKEVVPYISGVLVKNLECCVKESEEDLKKSSSEVFEI